MYSANEVDGGVIVEVAVLSGELSDEVVVRLTTQDGTATELDDYNATVSMLMFGPGATHLSVFIPITNDNVYEPSVENFLSNLELVTDNVDVIVRPSEAVVEVTDDDSKYSITGEGGIKHPRKLYPPPPQLRNINIFSLVNVYYFNSPSSSL